jgi:hypothetical protein
MDNKVVRMSGEEALAIGQAKRDYILALVKASGFSSKDRVDLGGYPKMS